MFDLPPSISTYGAEIDGVMAYIGWIVGAWFVLAEGLLIYFLVRYRRRKNTRAAWLPADTWKTNAWVLIPCVLVLVFDLMIELRSASVWDKVTVDVPPHDVLVRVTGRQFVWTFTYAGADGVLDSADDFQTVNEMHVPRDRVVRVQLESVDVLHAFWVPALRLKQDVVPGRSIASWFEATTDGVYDLACAELCGPAHTSMRAKLTVEDPAVFETWAQLRAQQQALQEIPQS